MVEEASLVFRFCCGTSGGCGDRVDHHREHAGDRITGLGVLEDH